MQSHDPTPLLHQNSTPNPVSFFKTPPMVVSEIIRYIKGREFVRFAPDWAFAAGLVVYFFLIAEHARPFNRQFSIADLTISHPFAVHERVTGEACIWLASAIPLVTITVVSAAKRGRLSVQQALHGLQIAVLGLVLSLTISGVVTDTLKNWISRPRPDFLARCGPKQGTPIDELVDISVCTAPLGQLALVDGMRSTPSGHSSISFSGLLYLTLWLLGQFKLFSAKTHQDAYKVLLCFAPVLLATYVALSRTQDYRHHFTDIILGGALGITFAIALYLRYYPSLWSEESDKPLDEEPETILPH